MYRNYIKTTFRNIRRRKFYTFINVTGLSAGIASCILIGLYVADEFSFDRFHEKSDRIVRLTMEYSNGNDVNHAELTGTKPGPFFYRNFPAIQAYTRMIPMSGILSYKNNIFEEKNILYADSTFFQMFTFPLIAGDPQTVLDTPGKIVLTQSMSEKYFGNTDPIGKILLVNGDKELMITGVTEDPPGPSQINFDFLIPFSELNASKTEEWFSANYYTYLLLDQGASITETELQIDQYMQSIKGKELDINANDYLTYHLEPLTRVHLYSSLEAMVPNGNITHIYILLLIGFLILLIACINYTNLAIAQSVGRQKEIGMRKVLGAQRIQLFYYFITESNLLAALSALLAWILALQLLPLFNELTGRSFNVGSLVSPNALFLLFILSLVVGIFSGFYPALILSRFRSSEILKKSIDLKITSKGLGRSLIVFQFAVSIFLIIAAVIIQQQRNFIQNKYLGYDKENIIVLPNDSQVKPYYSRLKEAIKLDPGVINVSAGYDLPTFIRWTNSVTATTDQGEKNFTTKALPVDLDFLETMNIEILSGSGFTEADLKEVKVSKEKKEYRTYFIINESTLRELGWTEDKAIGQTIKCGMTGTIKAVVKNFHISSLHNTISPLVIFLDDQFLNLIFVKVEGKNIPATLARLKNIWGDQIGTRPFEYHFLDEDYDKLYKAEQKSAHFISTFAGLAILLACLGLFGLSAFMAVKRTKEIGIRKILGASVGEIVMLLSRDMISMVVVACLIALPVGWLAAGKWLEGFAYHIDIQFWVFVMAGILALLISLFTVGLQSIKAAMANPVDSLKNE